MRRLLAAVFVISALFAATNVCAGEMSVTKCTVTAGSKDNSDAISFSGQMNATADDFNGVSVIEVTVDSNDMVNSCVQSFPINETTFKNGKYKCSKTENSSKTSVTFDTKTTKFSFTAKNVDLSGLGCPLTVEIRVGDYTGAAEVNEAIVNGAKKPIPIKLMMGVKNALRVDSYKVKRGKKPNTDQLTVKGGFAVEDPNVNLVEEEFVVTLEEQTFMLPAGSFTAKKDKFTCSKVNLSDGSVAAADFNFKTCVFTVTIKNTEILANASTVDFGLEFADFSESVQIVLVGTGLLEGAIDYTGPYPEPDTVSYMDNGQTVDVLAYPGQVLVFFKTPISETDAQELIEAAGGTILAKIPKVGYYLVGVDVGAEAEFISAISTDSRVSLAAPHMIGVRGSGAILLEGCSGSGYDLWHYNHVKDAFVNNGGVSYQCRDIYNGTAGESTLQMIVMEIYREANQNGSGTTFLNLSSYGSVKGLSGGLMNGVNWWNRTSEEQKQLKNAWYLFMAVTLNAIAALPPEYRENLVITICTGNNNMPICNEIARLRMNPRFAEILRDNVLLVSTTLMAGNSCPGDPNVAIVNNREAADGTSFAAPAALALIENIRILADVSAKKALQAVKRAVAADPNHQLIQSEAIDQARPPSFMLSIGTAGSGSGTVTVKPLPNVEPGGKYSDGTVVTLTAKEDDGCTFAGWSGDVTGTGKSVKIKMTGHKSVTATFNRTSGGGPQTWLITAGGQIATLTVDSSGNFTGSGWMVSVPDGSFPLNITNGEMSGNSIIFSVSGSGFGVTENGTGTGTFSDAPYPFGWVAIGTVIINVTSPLGSFVDTEDWVAVRQ